MCPEAGGNIGRRGVIHCGFGGLVCGCEVSTRTLPMSIKGDPIMKPHIVGNTTTEATKAKTDPAQARAVHPDDPEYTGNQLDPREERV